MNSYKLISFSQKSGHHELTSLGESLKSDLIEMFQDNLESILVYGSSLVYEEFIDQDLLVILKEKKESVQDLKKIKEILDKNTNIHLDLQLQYLEEVIPEGYSLDSHGYFFLEILSKAYPIFGENPFEKEPIDINKKRLSLINQIQNYVFRARQELIGYGRPSKDKNPIYHPKKIKFILRDILLYTNYELSKDYISQFSGIFPDVLDSNTIKALNENENMSIIEALPIYEKLYTFVLKRFANDTNEDKIKRINFNGMVCEYIIRGEKSILLLEGLPAVPKRHETLRMLANLGYSVFYPRYKGTWESEGEFLSDNPMTDINEFISALRKGLDFNGVVKSFTQIKILSTSFGGYIALNLDLSQVDKLICLSPVVDFKQVEGIETLESALKKNYPMAYRFNSEVWGKLLNNRYSNFTSLEENSKKVSVLAGADDKSIKAEDLEKFAQNYILNLKILQSKEHLSFSDLSETNILREILNHI